MEDEVSRLTALLENKFGEKFPAKKPKFRLITTADLPPRAAELYDDTTRERLRDRVRMWSRVYQIEQWVRQQYGGYATLEEMTDDDLTRLLERVESGVQCIRDGVGFDEAGLL